MATETLKGSIMCDQNCFSTPCDLSFRCDNQHLCHCHLIRPVREWRWNLCPNKRSQGAEKQFWSHIIQILKDQNCFLFAEEDLCDREFVGLYEYAYFVAFGEEWCREKILLKWLWRKPNKTPIFCNIYTVEHFMAFSLNDLKSCPKCTQHTSTWRTEGRQTFFAQ